MRTRLLAPVVFVCTLTAFAFAADPPPGFPPGKSFTYKTTNATLGAVLDELAKQTGVNVERSKAETERTLRIDCTKLSFWDAFERIARESDHRIAVVEGGKKLQLLGGGDVVYRETPNSVDRVFRIAAKKIQATSEFDTDRSFVEVLLTLNWEPGVAVFLVDQPGRATVAKDSADQDLRVAEDGGGRVVAGGNGVDLKLTLVGVQRAARSIKLIEGKIGVIGAAGTLDFAFPKPIATEEVRSTTKEEVTVKIRTDFKEGADLWSARVEYEYPAGGPTLESYESTAWLIDNQVSLDGADGKTKLNNNGGFEVVAQGDRRAVVIYRFTDEPGIKLGKPDNWTLNVRTPARLLSTEVKYRLENVPLP